MLRDPVEEAIELLKMIKGEAILAKQELCYPSHPALKVWVRC